jgi:glycosyltransferase involved in cell wall biosynthesis
VEFILIRTKDEFPHSPPECPGHFTYTVVDARKSELPGYLRLAYWAGWPKELALRQLYPARKTLLREAKKRIQNDDKAIHVFHFLRAANVIPTLRTARTIWTCHEIESEYFTRNFTLDQALEKRQPHGWERRKLGRLSGLEREVARACGLVLCVSAADAKWMAEEWSVRRAAYFPMSIPDEDWTDTSRKNRTPGMLRLMHIGALGHLPTYTSLEFLLCRVFPLLDLHTMSGLSLEIAGSSVADNERTKAIMEMARPYPMVKFSGFVDEISTCYRRNDLQVVASTQATGRRTRIIESWALGVPVLSTTVGAGGVEHLQPGRNILIADDPRDFARNLQELVHFPERLDEIARAARQTYESEYGRRPVAAALRGLLNAHFGLNLQSPAPEHLQSSP